MCIPTSAERDPAKLPGLRIERVDNLWTADRVLGRDVGLDRSGDRLFLCEVVAGSDPARAYWNSLTQLGRDEALALLAPDLVRALADVDPFLEFEQCYRRPHDVDALYRAQYADAHTSLTDGILVKVDRASMAVALEVRVPMLDHRFAGRFVNLPTAEIKGISAPLDCRAMAFNADAVSLLKLLSVGTIAMAPTTDLPDHLR